MRLALTFLVLLSAVALVPSPCRAETRYVIDQLIVSVRSSPSEGAELLGTVRTGEAVEVLDTGPDYLKIRTAKGTVGYSQKQYFSADLPKATVISRLEKERGQLQQQLAACQKAREQAGAALGEAKGLGDELAKTKQQLTDAVQRYNQLAKDAGNVTNIIQARDQLQQQVKQQQQQLEVLRRENESLIRSTGFYWLAAGAGIFFLGWLIGKISRKRRSGF